MPRALDDVQIALRSLTRKPGFTAVVVATLALGLGAAAAVSSVVYGVLLEPLPYPEPDRLVRLSNRWQESPRADLSPAEALDVRDRLRSFEAFGVYAGGTLALTGEGDPERLPAAAASAGLFPALGVEPLLGRTFTVSEDLPDAEGVVVLSHALWQRRFGGSQGVLGRRITLGGVPRTVVGVMPPGFRLPADLAEREAAQLFVPLALDPAQRAERGSHFLAGIGRLAPGVSVERATREAAALAASFVREYPEEYPEGMRFDSFVLPLDEDILGGVRRPLLLLSGAVALLLLAAATNVLALILARAEDRRRELAVRAALGAGRAGLARLALAESLLLSLAGGGAGLLLALWAVEALPALYPAALPRSSEIALDPPVVAFTAALSVVLGLAFALLPTLRLGRWADSLRQGGRSSGSLRQQRVRGALVVAQVALALVLLAGAGLLLSSLRSLLAVDPGFDPRRVVTVDLDLPSSRYAETGRATGFYGELLDRVKSLPGVDAAGAVSGLPLATVRGDLNLTIEGREQVPGEASRNADWQVVTPGYFDAVGMEILRGRGLEASDTEDSPGAVVINETMARQYWPREDPLGSRFLLGGGAGPGWVTVVGIVRDVRHRSLAAEPQREMYLPHRQFRLWGSGAPLYGMTVALRTARAAHDSGEIGKLVAREVHALDPALPVPAPTTLEEVRHASVAEPRFLALLLGTFAVLALVLSAIGLYGVLSYSVARRRQEIGIRMAIGAGAGQVVRMVLRRGLALTLLGLVLGLAGALALSRFLASLLFATRPGDPLVLTAVSLLLLAVTLLACMLPALRAARTDPVRVLSDGSA